MVARAKVIGRLSGASTIAVVLGLCGLVAATLPEPRGKVLGWSGTSAASAAGISSASGGMGSSLNSGMRVVRARSIPVEVGGGGEPDQAPIVQVAAKRRSEGARDREQVPETTWDGTPASRDMVPPATTEPKASPATPAASTAKPAIGPAAPSSRDINKDAGKDATTAVAPAGVEAPAVPEQWSPEEVAAALKQCVMLLGPVDAEIEPIEATKKGPCGAPAPVRLKSVGSKDEKVEFIPPIEINCQMVVKLGEWIETALQPAAVETLSARVTKIAGASGYQCRNRYGLANAPLSEHALANAVDIPGFVLANGRQVRVVSGWGPTARDLVVRAEGDGKSAEGSDRASETVDDAKTAASKDTKDKSKPAANGSASKAKTAVSPEKVEAKGTPSKTDVVSSDTSKATTGKTDSKKKQKVAEMKGAGIQKLGVPASITSPASVKPAAEQTAKEVTSDGRFLRKAYAGACSTFGTVLGPEANEAHRDHFHLDLKARRKLAYCQ